MTSSLPELSGNSKTRRTNMCPGRSGKPLRSLIKARDRTQRLCTQTKEAGSSRCWLSPRRGTHGILLGVKMRRIFNLSAMCAVFGFSKPTRRKFSKGLMPSLVKAIRPKGHGSGLSFTHRTPGRAPENLGVLRVWGRFWACGS